MTQEPGDVCAKTLMEMAGVNLTPAAMNDAVLVLIDMQNEYLAGTIAGADPAVARAQTLLQSAHACGAPVIHVAHKGDVGDLFDRDAHRGQIIDLLKPMRGETVIEKLRRIHLQARSFTRPFSSIAAVNSS